jgi:hypothetical protein
MAHEDPGGVISAALGRYKEGNTAEAQPFALVAMLARGGELRDHCALRFRGSHLALSAVRPASRRSPASDGESGSAV